MSLTFNRRCFLRTAGTAAAGLAASPVLNGMEKVHPGARDNFEGGTSVSWANDPYARGAISWFRPGEMTRWLPELARPEGRIHFAGEHTSVLAVPIEGALESGVRAARQIHKAAES